MNGLPAATGNLSFELVVVIVAISMIAGAVDLLRQPGWAWRRAEESKPAYFVLVLLVPLVGLGMYLHTARPKVKAIAAAGRAASLPFERFGDDVAQAQRDDVWPIGTIAAPGRFGSFGATTITDGEVRLIEPLAAAIEPLAAATEPLAAMTEPLAAMTEPLAAATEPVDGGGGSLGAGGVATATAPVALTRTYRPTQRTSLPVAAPAAEGTSTQEIPPGWKADPTSRHQFRYWAGSQWTENVADNGEQSRDSMTS
jgi:hypothetical protein